MSCSYYDEFINSVYEEIGEASGYSHEYLAYWFSENANLAKLNNLIGTCYSASYVTGEYGELISYSIKPEIKKEELSVYQKIFELDFYNKQAKNINRGHSAYAASNWTSLKEGNSSISRINKSDIVKSYKSIAKNCKSELDKLVKSYLKFRSVPQMIVEDSLDYIKIADFFPLPTSTPVPQPDSEAIYTMGDFGQQMKTINGELLGLIKK
jgi:hypothetical protein